MTIEPETTSVPAQALAVLCGQEFVTTKAVDEALRDMTEVDRWRFWIIAQEKSCELAGKIRSIAWNQHGFVAAVRTVLHNGGIPYTSAPESVKKLINERAKVRSIEHALSLRLGNKRSLLSLPILDGRHHIE